MIGVSVDGDITASQQHANHHDPVTNSHLPEGKSGFVAKARTAARDVPEIKGRYL
jgi:hypothetical protein